MEEKKESKANNKKKHRNDQKNNQDKNAASQPTDTEQVLTDEVDQEEYTLVGHTGPVFAVTISICDKHLLSGSFDNTIRRWSLQTKGPLMVYHGHISPIWDIKFSPLGSYFVSCSADKTAKLWILKNSQPLRIFANQGGHLNEIEAVEFHPNMHYIATGSSDR